MYDLFKERDLHCRKIVPRLFSEFDHRTDHYIAKQCSESSGALERKYLDPIERTRIFEMLMKEDYISHLKSTVEEVKTLFERYNLQFRLNEIDVVIHGFENICLVWSTRTHELVMDFMWDSTAFDRLPPVYKISLISSCGEFLQGDILNDTIRIFETDITLPTWFTDGLSRDS